MTAESISPPAATRTQKLRLSFKIWPHNVAWPAFRDFWIEADTIPYFRAGWVYDHFVPQTGWNGHEPLAKAIGPCFEAWTALAHIAALTTRVRMGTLVSSVTHRHPSVLAKTISTIDEVSGGRIEVGIGAGWNEPEHRQFGIRYPGAAERFDRLDEYLHVLSLLLSSGSTPVSYSGTFYSLENAYCLPGPVQLPRPPLTVGGKGPRRALPLVAKWADHWNFPSGTVEEFRDTLSHLGQLCTAAGRSIEDLDISAQFRFTDIDSVLRGIETFTNAGATHAIIWFAPPLIPAQLELLSSAVSQRFDVEHVAS